MIQTPFAIDAKYITCPACQSKHFRVDHLPSGIRTRWTCDRDECGAEFRVEVLSDGNIETTVTGSRWAPCLVTLRCEQPITIVVSHRQHDWAKDRKENPDDADSNTRYYYEEHTCPTNFLGVEEVITDDGDHDPHGIFKFVKMEPAQ